MSFPEDVGHKVLSTILLPKYAVEIIGNYLQTAVSVWFQDGQVSLPLRPFFAISHIII